MSTGDISAGDAGGSAPLPDAEANASGHTATRVAADSISVAAWTVVSRITGVGRVVMIAAVLGPTYLGNTFQATNVLPNFVYEILAGSLIATLLVPPLVRHVDLRDSRAVERLAGGFLGVAALAFAVVTAVAVVAAPLVMRLITLGVADEGIAAAQRSAGVVLIMLLMPQVLFYGIAGIGGAIMNAHGRFAFAAAAPALENVGVIATMALTAVLFGTGTEIIDVQTPQLLLLGLGSTVAVGMHAAAQWWGVRRVGVRLVPRAGWKDPEVREIIGRGIPSLGYAGLYALRNFAVLVVANRIPGGVVAFQLALNFFYLPIAIGAKPLATALLPPLSRLHHRGKLQEFRDELVQGAALTSFLIVPAAVAFGVLARPLAQAVAFGEMATGMGVTLLAASLAALAVGLVGEAGFVLGTHASYARHDAKAPLSAMASRTAVSLAGMAAAFFFIDGTALLVAVGAAISVGNVISAFHLGLRVRAGLPQRGETFTMSIVRSLLASTLMAGPAYLIAVRLPALLGGRFSHVIGMLVAGVAGLLIFVAAQRLFRSSELRSLRAGLSGRRAGTKP